MLDKGDIAQIENIVMTAFAKNARAAADTAEALAAHTEEQSEKRNGIQKSFIEQRIQLHEATCPASRELTEAKNKAFGGWWVLTALAGLLAGLAALYAQFGRKL